MADDVYWILRPGWFAKSDGDSLVVYSDTKASRFRASKSLPTGLADALNSGIPHASADRADFGGFITELAKRGVLVESSHTAVQSGYQAYFSHIYSDAALERLAKSGVVCLGVGGLGSIVLQHLVGAGVGRFVLIDHDEVESSNLERQFIYDRSQIGDEKVDAAAAYIRTRAPSADIICFSETVATVSQIASVGSLIRGTNLCVIAVDEPSPTVFNEISEQLWREQIPFIHAGVMARSGFFGPLFDPAHSPAGPAAFALHGEQPRPNGRGAEVAFAPYNTIIAAAVAAETIHYLGGAFESVDFQYRTFINFLKWTSSKHLRGDI